MIFFLFFQVHVNGIWYDLMGDASFFKLMFMGISRGKHKLRLLVRAFPAFNAKVTEFPPFCDGYFEFSEVSWDCE